MFGSVFLYIKYCLYKNITILIGRDGVILCVRATVRTPICVYLLRDLREEHRELSIRFTLRDVCKQAEQANYPGKSRIKPMFRRLKLPELGE